MYKDKSISVVVPCHNEELQIEAVVNGLPDFIDKIIIIDSVAWNLWCCDRHSYCLCHGRYIYKDICLKILSNSYLKCIFIKNYR